MQYPFNILVFYSRSNVSNFCELIRVELDIGPHLIDGRIGDVWGHMDSSCTVNVSVTQSILYSKFSVTVSCPYSSTKYFIIRVCSGKRFRDLVEEIRHLECICEE